MNVKIYIVTISLFAIAWGNTFAVETPTTNPEISVRDSNQKSKTWSRSQLLKLPLITTITLSPGEDPAYPNLTRTYKAIPISYLFKGMTLKGDHILSFEATDGYSAPLAPKYSDIAINPKAANPKAYLAIEMSDKPWPKLDEKHPGSAGPFYLIWTTTKQTKVPKSHWPFKLKALKMGPSIEKAYPLVAPSSRISRQSKVFSGYNIFVSHCFACHTINLQGSGKKGPDLNWPESPTEYFGSDRLKKYLRNPQSVRYWEQAQMKGFSVEDLPKDDLEALIEYLNHMASERRKKPSKILRLLKKLKM